MLVAAAWLALGCGPEREEAGEASAPASGAPEALPEPPTVEEAWSMERGALRRAATALGARAAERVGTPDGVADGRRAAALARVLSIRDPEAEWIGRARAWLQEASRRRALEGACEAALAWARLEARDAGDVAAAYRVAYRTALRFEDRPADEACVARARAMMMTLEPWRPPASELAAIAADPDADDPTAGLDAEEAPARGASAGSLASWVAERVDRDATATLEGLTVLGHEVATQSGEDADAHGVRVVLRFDRVAAFEHGEAPARGDLPRRTWLELAATDLGEGVARSLEVDLGGLRRIRTREHEAGARVTFDLDDDARFRAFVLPEPHRVVLDVERGGPSAPGPVRRIVLDPGHGGDDFGARAFGMREADLTLDLATRLRTLLTRRLPDVQVALTREEDTPISLEQRVAMANAMNADLFLSIHLNAADEEVDHGGVTTFVLDTSDDRQALRLAARENGTSVAEVDSLARILASLHREDQVRASRAFAEQVHRATLGAGRRVLPGLHDRGVKSALFYVLVGARMPAVLLEASFLSREEEAEALRTAAYRQALAEGMAEGIARWAGR